uniref:Uncharacterized protein n=1 Tax=Oryza punctata TaxID=4537 RepID=A0A0E0KWQ5_ORYPU
MGFLKPQKSRKHQEFNKILHRSCRIKAKQPVLDGPRTSTKRILRELRSREPETTQIQNENHRIQPPGIGVAGILRWRNGSTQRRGMVSMGFLEPSTGRDDQRQNREVDNSVFFSENWRPRPQFQHEHIPPTSSQFKKACGKHARTSFPITILAASSHHHQEQ